jgi:hypothetical protein
MIAILASGAGALLAWAPTAAELPAPPAESTVRELAAWDAPPPLPYVWTPSLLDWAVPDTRVRLTRLEFRWRYTLAEQIAIDVATTDHADATVRATLRVLAASLAEANDIDLTDPRTVQGVQYHEALGLIAPGRAAEILG